MPKLEEYIEKTRKRLSLMEDHKAKGYYEFFKDISELTYDNNDSRDCLFEYFMTNMANFFEQNGVEYEADLSNYINGAYMPSYTKIEDIVRPMKDSAHVIKGAAGKNNITLGEDGFLDFPALLYGLSAFPEMRERLTEVFGAELISEEIFPNFDIMQRKLEKVMKIATAILEKRNIDSLSDKEIIARIISDDKNIHAENEAIEEITKKLKAIEESIQQNGIYTLENHPTYAKLQQQLKEHTEARDAIVKQITEKDPSDLRDEIKLSLGVQDYEKMHETYKYEATVMEGLKSKGVSLPEALQAVTRSVNETQSRLQRMNALKLDIRDHGKKLEVLDIFMSSPEFESLYRSEVERENLEHVLADKKIACDKSKATKESAEKAKEKYDKLGYFAKKGEEGKRLKEEVDRSEGIDERIKKEEAELQTASELFSKSRTAFIDAQKRYDGLFEQLDQEYGGMLSRALQAEFYGAKLTLRKKEEIKQRRETIASALASSEEQLTQQYPETEEELKDTIEEGKKQISVLSGMIEERKNGATPDEGFLDALETAVDLVNEAVETNEDQDAISSHK